MKTPWQDRTGLAKAVAVLSSVLVVSLGLCGANFFAVMRFGSPLGGGSATALGTIFTATGVIELLLIIGCVIGLLLVGIAAAFRHFSSSGDKGNP